MKRLFLAIPVATALLAGSAASRAVEFGGMDEVKHYIEREATAAASAATGIPVRVEVTIGTLDAQVQPAPCARVEPILEPGVRLWGHSHFGLRCTAGAAWTLQWPLTVRVYGQALLAARPLLALQPIVPADLRAAEIELSRASQGVVTTAAQVQARVPARAIGAGQPIPLELLRGVVAVGQGDSVKLVASGSGFSIITDGVALNAAGEGEAVRVRTENGRVLSGTARAGRVIEVSF